MRCHCWNFDGHFTQDWFKLQEMVFSLAIFFCLYLPLNGSLWIFVCVRALFLNIFHLLNSIRQKSSGQFFVSLHVYRFAPTKCVEFVYVFSSPLSAVCIECATFLSQNKWAQSIWIEMNYIYLSIDFFHE